MTASHPTLTDAEKAFFAWNPTAAALMVNDRAVLIRINPDPMYRLFEVYERRGTRLAYISGHTTEDEARRIFATKYPTKETV